MNKSKTGMYPPTNYSISHQSLIKITILILYKHLIRPRNGTATHIPRHLRFDFVAVEVLFPRHFFGILQKLYFTLLQDN